jgi:hypothetical protein
MGIRSSQSVRIVRGVPSGAKLTSAMVPASGVKPESGTASSFRISGRSITFGGLNMDVSILEDYLDRQLRKLHPSLTFQAEDQSQGAHMDGWLRGKIVSRKDKTLPVKLPIIVDEFDDYHDILWLEKLVDDLNPQLGAWELGYAPLGTGRSGFQGYVAVVDRSEDVLKNNPKLVALAKLLEEEMDG